VHHEVACLTLRCTFMNLSLAKTLSADRLWRTDTPWIPHLQTMEPYTDPFIRGTLGYKSADLNGDGYPEVVYNAMFDIPNTDPPRYRGEIWLGVNPGPQGLDSPPIEIH